MRLASPIIVGSLALGLAMPAARAQGAAAPGPKPLAVGTVAPDFTLPAATQFGLLKAPIHLGDFRGKTVVLAFFFKARTRG